MTDATFKNNRGARNISVFVVDILLLIGLVAEYLALTSILSEGHVLDSDFDLWIARLAIVFMLIHHYFIIKNFYSIDHLGYEDLRISGFGNWVLKSRIEDVIRLVLFVLFACLTGEIIYLRIVAMKSYDLSHGAYFNGNTGQAKAYNLTWMTSFYINCALLMSMMMLVWDIGGKIYDKWINPILENEIESKTKTPKKIISFPFKDPFWTFLISDSLGLCFWYCIRAIIIHHNIWYFHILSILVLGYGTFIIIRLWGWIIAKSPKLKTSLGDYWKNSSW